MAERAAWLRVTPGDQT